jgi:lipopolysaccharide/colanic/teichoic acid biosynthesis glycosyltransferase
MTGLWQVTRSPERKADFQEWIYYDLLYVKHQSIWLDCQILWQTLRVVTKFGPSKQWRQRWRPNSSSHEID